MALCVKCHERDATAKCVTCARCRAYMHRWGNESSDRIIEHWRRLRLRESLVETVTVVDVDDERVSYIKQDELQKKRLLFASRLKRKAKAVVISIKTAEARRKRA